MLSGHARILRLVELLGEVTGRKKLHKMVFIAKKMQIDFDVRFQYHMYGPYSEELTVRVDELCGLGLLDEQKESKGAIDLYRYTINETGRAYLRQRHVDLGGGERLFLRLNEENSRFLELVSTILFFDYLPDDEMRAKVLTLKSKQRYSEEEFDKALEFIAEIRQIHMQ